MTKRRVNFFAARELKKEDANINEPDIKLYHPIKALKITK